LHPIKQFRRPWREFQLLPRTDVRTGRIRSACVS
jgi:hypothetical protein